MISTTDGGSRSNPGVHGENSSAAMPNRAKLVTPGLRSSCKMSLITACCVPQSSVTALSSARGSSAAAASGDIVLRVELPCAPSSSVVAEFRRHNRPPGLLFLLLLRAPLCRVAPPMGADVSRAETNRFLAARLLQSCLDVDSNMRWFRVLAAAGR